MPVRARRVATETTRSSDEIPSLEKLVKVPGKVYLSGAFFMAVFSRVGSLMSKGIRRTFLAFLVALVATSTLAWSGESNRLRGTQFIGLVKEKTLSGETTAGVKFHIFFLRGGAVTYEDERGRKDNGKWRVTKRDAVCVRWKRMFKGAERCAYAYFRNGKLTYRGAIGMGTVNLLAYIAEGF